MAAARAQRFPAAVLQMMVDCVRPDPEDRPSSQRVFQLFEQLASFQPAPSAEDAARRRAAADGERADARPDAKGAAADGERTDAPRRDSKGKKKRRDGSFFSASQASSRLAPPRPRPGAPTLQVPGADPLDDSFGDPFFLARYGRP